MPTIVKILLGRGRWEHRYLMLGLGGLVMAGGIALAISESPMALRVGGGVIAAFLSLVTLPSWLVYSGER